MTEAAEQGIWTLTAPSGRTWTGDSPLKVCATEQRERVPAYVALERIRAEVARDQGEIIKRLTAAMREADETFETVGGSTRHYVRDCLLPILEKHGLDIGSTSNGGEQR